MLSKEKIDYIKNNWQNLTCKELAQKIGCDDFNVRYILTKNKIKKGYINYRKKYKYSLNHNYFEKIDTPNKAYIAGFILADGSINRTKNKYALYITLKHCDDSILKFILQELQSNVPIIYREYKYQSSKTCNIVIHSKKMVTDLIKLGITPNKTYKNIVPKINKALCGHFLRGFFDGDGCISICKRNIKGYCNNSLFWTITAKRKSFLINLKKICKLDIGKIYKYSKRKCYDWRLYSFKDIMYIYNFMYKDAEFYLTRKYNKFQEIFNVKNTNIGD